jgi:hypothetical protein
MAEALARPGAGLDGPAPEGITGLGMSGPGGTAGLGGSIIRGGSGVAVGGFGTIRTARPSVKVSPGADAVLASHAQAKGLRLDRCYRAFLARKPGWKGVVAATLRADAGGDVASVAIEGAPDDPLRDCLATALLGPVDRPGDVAIDGRLELSLDPGKAP